MYHEYNVLTAVEYNQVSLVSLEFDRKLQLPKAHLLYFGNFQSLLCVVEGTCMFNNLSCANDCRQDKNVVAIVNSAFLSISSV